MRFWAPLEADETLLAPARAAIAEVGLNGRLAFAAQDLSHGERRQLELAMALAMEPRLLLLDEPMAGMGRQDCAKLEQLLAKLKQRYTILLVEHDMGAVFALADRITVLVAGQAIATGTRTTSGMMPASATPILAIQRRSDPMLLQIRNLQTSYGLSQVLFGVSLALVPGEVITLMGRNGMGKTTTANSVTGLCKPHAGEILFEGERIDGLAPHQIARRGIGLVPEGRRIFPNLTVRENLLMAYNNRRGAKDPWTFERVLDFFRARRTARQCRQSIVRRRAADAGDRARADDQSDLAGA